MESQVESFSTFGVTFWPDDTGMKNASMTGVCMALAAAALWGTTGVAQSFASAQASPYWIGALRLAIASMFLAACIAWRQRGTGKGALGMPRPLWCWIGLAGACMAAYNLTFFAGIKATGIAIGTSIAIGSGPVWAGLLQTLVSRRPPPTAWWLGTLLAVGGGSLMVLPAGGDSLQVNGLGLGLCLAAGLAYASYTLISQRLVQQLPPTAVTFWVFTVAAIFAVPAAFMLSGRLALAPTGWLVVGYLGLVATGLAYLLFSYALQYISAATGVTLALGEPVTAFALAVWLVHERPAPLAFAGLAMVLGGLLLVVWVEARPWRMSRPSH